MVEGLLYDLIIDDQDHSAELLRAGEVAGAITASATTVPGCDATGLGDLTYVAFASPDFAAVHFPQGVTRPALTAAPAITYSRKDRLQRAWAERVAGEKVALRTHYLGSTHGITEAARAGLGWAVNPAPLIAPHFADGSLVPLRPDITLATPLVWQVPRRNAAALRDLTRALITASRRAAVS